MKSFVLLFCLFAANLFFQPCAHAGGDGVFPLMLEQGHWQSFSGHYSVRFDFDDVDHRYLNVTVYGRDRVSPIAWGQASPKSRDGFMDLELHDVNQNVWTGFLYRCDSGVHLQVSDGDRQFTLDLVNLRLPPRR